jgi:hypothetical protein
MKDNPSPLRSIRLKCLDCSGLSQEVTLCPAGNHCTLHPYRTGHRPEGISSYRPLKTIREYCLQCGEENSSQGVEACPIHGCPLYPYRNGSHPGRKGRILTEQEKAVIAERLAAGRKGQICPK